MDPETRLIYERMQLHDLMKQHPEWSLNCFLTLAHGLVSRHCMIRGLHDASKFHNIVASPCVKIPRFLCCYKRDCATMFCNVSLS